MLLEKGVCYDQCVSWKNSVTFSLLHFVFKAKLAYYSGYLLTFYFCILIPYDEKDFFFFFWVLVLGLIGLHRNSQLQLLWYYWLGHRLRLL